MRSALANPTDVCLARARLADHKFGFADPVAARFPAPSINGGPSTSGGVRLEFRPGAGVGRPTTNRNRPDQASGGAASTSAASSRFQCDGQLQASAVA